MPEKHSEGVWSDGLPVEHQRVARPDALPPDTWRGLAVAWVVVAAVVFYVLLAIGVIAR